MSQSKLLKLNSIAAMYYASYKRSNTAVVYAIGAPTVPDNGSHPDALLINSYGVDVLVPDYIGFGRSDGFFTPRNCIQTLLSVREWLSKGVTGKTGYDHSSVYLKYKRILFIGRSLGGAYVPLLPKFNPMIRELCLIFPAVDQSEQGKDKPEETNEDFMRSMKNDGYHHLYRGVLNKVWWNHLYDKDGLSPMDTIDALKHTRMFIGHGKRDTCINYKKSVRYFEKLIGVFPAKKKDFKIKLYTQSGHDYVTSGKATKDFLEWIL